MHKKENLELAASMGDIESDAAVTDQIEKDIARHKSNMQDIDAQIKEWDSLRGPTESNAPTPYVFKR